MGTYKIKNFLQSDAFYFAALTGILLVLFQSTFTMPFYSDDFAFLHLSHPKSIYDIIGFFQPGKAYFYRPLSSEAFYSIVNFFGAQTFIAHIIMFITFIYSLWMMLIVLYRIFHNAALPKIITAIYALSFTHLFQLSQAATYQEILMFATIVTSFYFFLKNRYMVSLIFFICGLMSKETAIVYPLFLILYTFFFSSFTKKRALYLIIFTVLSVQFFIVYYLSIRTVSTLEVYKIHLSPRLMINNLLWYSLWSLGFPNNLSDYMPTILGLPRPDFFNAIETVSDKIYLFLLLFFNIILIGSAILLTATKKIKFHTLKILVFLYISFTLFLLPVLVIIHKWMVRLTIPHLFMSIIIGYLIYQIFWKSRYRVHALALLTLIYMLFTLTALNYHEVSGYYRNNRATQTVAIEVFAKHKTEIESKGYVFFSDDHKEGNNSFKNSQELFTAFSDQSFASYYFPHHKVKAIYAFKENKTPGYSYYFNSRIFTNH